MPDEFERLIPDFLALARRIFDSGVEAERKRLLALLQSPNGAVAASGRTRKTSETKPTTGSVSTPVREALIKLVPSSPDGIGPRQIAEHFQRIGSGPNERQVRAALKTLTISGEAIRASRGRYLPRGAAVPPISGENPDDDASGHFSLAAE